MTSLKLPYYYPGSKTGCLLIHGFTSTPAELRPIGEALHKADYSVYGILLKGHGTQPEDLLAVRYKDWLESAQQGVNKLKQSCQKIVVVGHSLGGLLALQMAARNTLHGVVTIAAALKLTDPKARLAWFFKHIQKYASSQPKKLPAKQQQYLLHYPFFPVASVAELQSLAWHTRSILPQVTTNALIIQTKDDGTVRPESAEIISKHISSQHKRCLWLEKGTHNVPVVPPYNGQIAAEIIDFIENINQTAR